MRGLDCGDDAWRGEEGPAVGTVKRQVPFHVIAAHARGLYTLTFSTTHLNTSTKRSPIELRTI